VITDEALPALDESLLVADHTADFDHIASHIISQDFNGLKLWENCRLE
jgi:stress-induced morphogen